MKNPLDCDCPLCKAGVVKKYYIKVYLNGIQTPENERMMVVSEETFKKLNNIPI